MAQGVYRFLILVKPKSLQVLLDQLLNCLGCPWSTLSKEQVVVGAGSFASCMLPSKELPKVFFQGIRYLDCPAFGAFAVTHEHGAFTITGFNIPPPDIRRLTYAQTCTRKKVNSHPFSHSRNLISVHIESGLVPNCAPNKLYLLLIVVFDAVDIFNLAGLSVARLFLLAWKRNNSACLDIHDFPLCFSIEFLAQFETKE
jgi:hypothetical protein